NDGMKLAERVKASGATAAVVTDDEVAVGLLNGLVNNGVNVPEDFEIITANNSVITEFTRPTLSSIEQPLYDLGAVSMRLLTKMMHKEEVDEKRVILPHGIVKRGSTK
ncbi:MAG: substrate-binding domain-containing protein, partial [Lactococcus sp.]|nr:substrate-binding domain-containing protein [Lactococcus sp.]